MSSEESIPCETENINIAEKKMTQTFDKNRRYDLDKSTKLFFGEIF